MIRVRQLSFRYPGSTFELGVEALEVEPGERIALIGPSGSGKTTLLNLLAGIDTPARGVVEMNGTDLTALGDAERRAFRLQHVGLVFQAFELLDYLSVLDNILLPLRIGAGRRVSAADRSRAAGLAADVGIGDKLGRHPQHLSQGERQRLAVCRALLLDPCVLLADEPTGNLDPENKQLVVTLLLERAIAENAALVMVTHDRAFLDRFDRVLDFAELNRPTAA